MKTNCEFLATGWQRNLRSKTLVFNTIKLIYG